MGLRDAIQGAVNAGINALGDIPVSTNYESLSSSTYDASAGTPTTVYSTIAGVKVVIGEFRFVANAGIRGSAPDFDVKAQDKEALISGKALSTTITPKPEDRIVHDGETWNVVNVFTDPAEGAWVLQIRRE